MPPLSPKVPIQLPGCKSASARALVLSAISEGAWCLRGLSECEDTTYLKRALRAWGASFSSSQEGLEVRGWDGVPPSTSALLDAGEAATNLRFLLALAGLSEGPILLSGSDALMRRPHGPLLDFLQQKGCEIRFFQKEGRKCIEVSGDPLSGGEWVGPGELSSQFLSGLALAAKARGDVQLILPEERVSSGYFKMTQDMISNFSELSQRGERCFSIPADASGATFFLVALCLHGGELVFEREWSDEHPEASVGRWLVGEGLLEAEGTMWKSTGKVPERALSLNIDAFPDAGPALAILAASLPSGILFCGLGRLKIKESDRFDGMIRLAQSAGGEVVVKGEDTLHITLLPSSTKLQEPFDSSGDHRLAMAAGIAGLEVQNPSCVSKSFPRFWEEFAACMRS